MEKIVSSLTVFFEEPFWIGIYERETDEQCEVCKITFGAEPKDCEVLVFLLRNWYQLSLSPPVAAEQHQVKRINPKRMQRSIRRQMQDQGIGTKAQQALKLQQEQGKAAGKIRSRIQREAKEERKFELRREKRKAKHKGH